MKNSSQYLPKSGNSIHAQSNALTGRESHGDFAPAAGRVGKRHGGALIASGEGFDTRRVGVDLPEAIGQEVRQGNLLLPYKAALR